MEKAGGQVVLGLSRDSGSVCPVSAASLLRQQNPFPKNDRVPVVNLRQSLEAGGGVTDVWEMRH